MDRRFIEHYNDELVHLRQVAGQFARANPSIARRLDLSADGLCDDPHVERLLEGFAFLTARIQLKMAAEFPRFTQGLLETVYPHYVTPMPATVIAHCEPKLQDPKALLTGYAIPRGTKLKAFTGGAERRPCFFTTAHPVTLWPIELVRADYMVGDLNAVGVNSSDASAVLRLRLKVPANCTFSQLPVDNLAFYIKELGKIAVAELLYEDIFSRKQGLIVQSTQRPYQRLATLHGSTIQPVGFADDQALLPVDPRAFQGYRLLREYFAFPQRFLFFQLNGLNAALRTCKAAEVDLLLLLRPRENLAADRSPQLEDKVDASHLELFCTPAINLFALDEMDRVPVDSRFNEFQAIPDRVHPLHEEVFQIQTVTGYGSQEREFKPFYFASNLRPDGGAFFTTHRVPRQLTPEEIRVGGETSYAGSDVFVSLVDAQCAPFQSDIIELGVKAFCTNRHLPILVPWNKGSTDFEIGQFPCTRIRCIGEPAPPMPAVPEGELTWRLISHLAFNHFSLLGSTDRNGPVDAAGLRELLKVYADLGTGSDISKPLRRIAGLKTVQTRTVTRRLPCPGPIAFGRGLNLTLEFDEKPMSGLGVFLIGAVLAEFLSRAASINSFVETIIRTEQRQEIMSWPARMGSRQML